MLSVRKLAVAFQTRRGIVDAVRGVSFELGRGEILGIVGESGSGKSVTSYALMRILDAGGTIKHGDATYSGVDLRRATEREMRGIRGREISMIFQNPRAALNPIRKVGHQIEDVLREHASATRANAREKAIEALEAVRIRDAAARYDAYPFELSGGMCQRVVCAIALACNPRVLIADEPTTGLDITTQKAVMDLVRDLIREREMSSILITHDLGLAAQYCDRIVVMKDGEIVEQGDPASLFSAPQHPYSRKLVDATPRAGESIRSLLPPEERRPMLAHSIEDRPLVEVRELQKTYRGKSGPVHAVKGSSFVINRGQSVGLVGESGCGKSTTSEILVRLTDATGGQVIFDGEDIGAIPAKRFARDPRRGEIQMVFQDATDSLNPRHTARQTIAEPLRRLSPLKGVQLTARIEELATLVGLPLPLLDRFPHQLSGGQKARVGIARAIALEPKFLVLDEPTAALDPRHQFRILDLIADFVARGGGALVVLHDVEMAARYASRLIWMKDGRIIAD
ncbi:MAG: ABC transporter ATP-binding protein, partial [Pseudomonadota bacterium]